MVKLLAWFGLILVSVSSQAFGQCYVIVEKDCDVIFGNGCSYSYCGIEDIGKECGRWGGHEPGASANVFDDAESGFDTVLPIFPQVLQSCGVYSNCECRYLGIRLRCIDWDSDEIDSYVEDIVGVGTCPD